MSKKRKDHEPETEAVDQVEEATADSVDAETDAGAFGAADGAGDEGAAETDPQGDAVTAEAALDADAPDAPADDAADDAGGAAAGAAGEPGDDAETLEPSTLEADAETAGEVPGTADPVADAIDANDDQPEAAETCPVCDQPFEAADLCATDVELGICHAACLEGAPTVNLDTGEPTEGPIDTFRYGEAEQPRTPWNRDVNALAALAAASVAFGTTNDDNTALPRMDVSWLGVFDDSGQRGIDVAMKAAAFVRANPAAPTAATRIELRRKKLAQPAEGDREAEAWEIFMFVLARLDTLDRTRREAEEAERRRIEQKPLSIPASQAALLPRETYQR